MEDAYKILTSSVLSAALIAALVWMFKERLTHSIRSGFDKELEAHKAQLQRDNELSIATFKTKVEHENELKLVEFKHKLELAATERNFKFSKVFDKTAEVIAEIYKKLQQYKQASDDFSIMAPITPEQSKRVERVQSSYQRRDEFYAYFYQHKIYVPTQTAERIKKVFGNLNNVVFNNFISSDMSNNPNVKSEVLQQRIQRLCDESSQTEALLTALEDDFQHILGFSMEEKDNSKQ